MKTFEQTDGKVTQNLNDIKNSTEKRASNGGGDGVASLESRRDSARPSAFALRLIDEKAAGREQPDANLPDLVCFSHLRWDFVYQRPQHLLSRYAREGRRVFFVEESVYDAGPMRIEVSERECGVRVVVPHLPEGLVSGVATDAVQQSLVDRLFAEHDIRDYVLWYYTPLAMGFTHHLQPQAVVYDCMDELSAFKGAPQALRFRETELLRRADLVFTGGLSLYEAKRQQYPQHRHIHPFPSSIDVQHFAQARALVEEPADQVAIPHPRLGFCGVIDERLDIELLCGVADARPDWQIVLIGPVVKIDEADLPRRANIHYLGKKGYKDLPAYMAGWDVALLPFAHNDSTRFISPTKTPEYLAAGRTVVSTSIRDVARPYGEMGLVRIADTVADFVQAIEASLAGNDNGWLRRVDLFLKQNSWDLTWERMSGLVEDATAARRRSVHGARALAVGGSTQAFSWS